MAIDYWFSSLEIENFRGIGNLTLELPAGGPLVIVGANNAGKSTILDALALTMEGPSAHNFTPEKYDYFCRRSGEHSHTFSLRLRLSARDKHELPAVRGAVSSPKPVHGAIVTGRTDKGGRHSHSSALMGEDGKPLTLISSLKMSAKDKGEWEGQSFGSPVRNARWYEINEHRPEVWLLRPSNLHVSLFTWKTGPLQRLASMLVRKFMDEKWDFEYQGKKSAMPEGIRKAHAFFRDAVANFPFWKDDLKPRLQKTLSLYLGRQADMELRPDLLTLEEWMAQQLLLGFAADSGGAITPLERMGHGWQSLVRIACLEVLSQYPEEIERQRVALLFEEPESYLHPHLSRKLRQVLDRLAEQKWLVVVTTHSPEFISFNGKQTIARLARTGDDVVASALHVEKVDEAPKFQERLDERGGHEMVFAQKVVLCEGQSDTFALRTYLTARANLDLDGQSVSIIRTGDVAQLPAFAGMASKLGVPWCAVSDEDIQPDGSTKAPTKAARDKLTALAGKADQQMIWKGDLETCLGRTGGKADPTWQAEHVHKLSDADLGKAFPEFVAGAERVRKWITGT